MENKQKAIEKAYGEHWESVKDYVDENGNLDKRLFTSASGIKYSDFDKILFEHFTNFTCRPLSLQGIETNNGWIKIESEADLPKDDSVLYDLSNIENKGYLVAENLYRLIDFYKSGTITHYAIHVQRKPPIY